MVTLDRVANVLGSYGVRLRFCSVPRSTRLSTVVLPERTGGRTVSGDVLLAVGAASVAEAVRWAVAARAAAVLVRGDDADTAFVGEGESVAVLVVDPAMSWSELAVVVYGLVLEGRETESGRGPTDLFGLADSLADAVDGAVTIEDTHSHVLAYSQRQQHADRARAETILNRQAADSLRTLFDERGIWAHLGASDEPLFVAADPDHGLTGRMVVAVRVGRELLGAVWVTCPAPLPGAALAALGDGARTVALHLLRSRASADLERRVESDWVTRLLDGAADAATMVIRLGLPQASLRVVAVRARIAADAQAGLLMAFERGTTGFGWSRPGRSALLADTVYTVLAAEQPADARRWVHNLRRALPAQTVVWAGISAVAPVDGLPAARLEADECLALHELGSPASPPPAFDQSWDAIVLQRLNTVAASGHPVIHGPVGELRRHDRQHATHYVATLRAWLAEQGDPARAAARLGVHENTVRNRLRRMTELADLGLDDAGRRFALMIDLACAEVVSKTDNA